jgi:hypothetical protein
VPDTLAVLHIGHTAQGAAEVVLTIVGAGFSLGGLLLGALALVRRGRRPRGDSLGASTPGSADREG